MSSVDDVTVRAAVAETDAPALARLYNHYIAETVVTFEEQPISADEIGQRILSIQAIPLPWLVAERDGELLGYAYASKWRERSAYRFSTESTVYLAPGLGRRGLGSRLYRELLADLRRRGIHAVMGGIALPNEASVALHEKCGFRKVAHFEQVGFKFNRWVDVGYWQLVL